jgi:hypothetical protein
MAGQRVVARKIASGGAAFATADNAKRSSSQSQSQSPVKNPFKRKKRRWLTSNSNSNTTSMATKIILFGFFSYCLVLMADINRLPQSLETPNDINIDIDSDSDNNLRRGQLDLRPDYLTDDSKDNKGVGDDEETTSGSHEEEEEEEDVEEEKEEEYADEEGEEEEEEEENDKSKEEEGEEEKVRLRSPSRRDREGQQHNHKIPRILIFTHYKNLLELEHELEHEHENKQYTDNAAPDANAYQNMTPDKLEELTLAANVRHSIDVHKNNRSGATLEEDEKEEELKVLFWTDNDCIRSLERTRPKLVSYFKTETEGMYKADICRGTALLEHGGFYLDVDVGVRHDLWKDLRPQTEFVTARVHQASNWVGKGFFQAILGASPKSPILQLYLELFEQHYDGTNRIRKGPLGVLLLKRAWDQVNDEREQLEKENSVPTELYQELLFQEHGPFDSGDNKGVLSPAPTWGKRRACHFIVVGIANDPSNIEMVLESSNNSDNSENGSDENGKKKQKKKEAIGLQIPVLSRIPGSRMCVADPKETETAAGDGSKSYNTTRMIESMKWWERT